MRNELPMTGRAGNSAPITRAPISVALPRGAVLLAILFAGAYAMGLLVDRLLVHYFGIGPELDAYLAALVLPRYFDCRRSCRPVFADPHGSREY